jgi:TetR/AcrR family transcriptional regulator
MIDLDSIPRRRSGRPDKPIPRADLLRTARELFASAGYAGVSMADIAHKAGLQKSSLFHHFPTKDQLYKEVLDGVLTEVSGAVIAAIGASTDFKSRLDASAAATAQSLGEDSTRARLIMRELLNEDGERGHKDSVVAVILATVEFLEAGAAAGAWPRQDFRQLVLTLAGIHCFYFAVPAITKQVSGADPFSSSAVGRRVDEVREHVRRMIAPV